MSNDLLIPNKEIPYLYVIEEVTTGRKYAGCRYAKGCNPIELLKEDGYQTSSNTIHNIIKKNGISSFKIIEILTEDDVGDVHEYETKFLRENNVSAKDEWINISENHILAAGSPQFKKAMTEKYGVEHIMQVEEHRHRIKNIWLDKIGYDNPMKSPEVKQKTKETWIKNGYEHPTHSPLVQAKRESTCLEKYGYAHPSHAPEIKEKKSETNLEKYGVKFPTQNKEVKEKKNNTCNERYGGNSPMCSIEVQEKAKLAMIEKYGVAYNGQRPEVREKLLESLKNRRSYKGEGNPSSGKSWMHNGINRIYCPEDRIDEFIEIGFKYGYRKDLPHLKIPKQ